MRHYKRIVSTLLAAGMGLSLLTGCQSGQPTGGTAAAEKTETGGKAEAASEDGAQDKKSELVVGMIASAFGTQSYNDDVLAGMELAEKELGVKGIPLEYPMKELQRKDRLPVRPRQQAGQNS